MTGGARREGRRIQANGMEYSQAILAFHALRARDRPRSGGGVEMRVVARGGAVCWVSCNLTMRVLIAPDKFKGTLTADAAAAAIARGWGRVRPRDLLELVPISDGGDGFGSVFAGLTCAKPVSTISINAAGQRCEVRWWWNAARKVAIVESARVIGLAMLPPGKFHPFQLDTRGLAVVLKAAAKRGARRCWVGIGGSATNDGGFGLARGLGWKFFNADGDEVECWTDLARLAKIEKPRRCDLPRKIVVAVDVQNPLLGARGCTRVYGPQKGLKTWQFAKAEAALLRLAKVIHKQSGEDVAKMPGAGAAGGLGFGLVAFAGAGLEPGFDLVAGAVHLNAKLRRSDLVITGEGRLDGSTLMGKGVGELAARCRKFGVDCFALGGSLADRATLARKFSYVGALTDLTSVSRARAEASMWLERLAAEAARQFRQP